MFLLTLIILLCVHCCNSTIDREAVVRKFNPYRTSSSQITPVQVGNGNFAFGADITGLQTFLPFNILSSWCWHNSSLPTTPGQTSPEDFAGLDWFTHGRLINYNQPNPSQPELSRWLIGNPHRVNLGRIGLYFENNSISELDLDNKSQHLDLFTGVLYSEFSLHGKKVQVQTVVHPERDTVAVSVQSSLLRDGSLKVFFDYPYAIDYQKFEAPFVGLYNVTGRHTTTLQARKRSATIRHDMDQTTYFNEIQWRSGASMQGPLPDSHKYVLSTQGRESIEFTSSYTPSSSEGSEHNVHSFSDIKSTSVDRWRRFWKDGAFIDVSVSGSPQAVELQRRIILSQYLLAVNYAGKDPPQESGLTNNGWYGKFHLEMYLWHNAHWALWGRWKLYSRNIDIYKRFLPTSLERARLQGYSGARWGKMSDPSSRSAPGEINSLLIWQQPHPMYFAELEYQSFPSKETVDRWAEVLDATAEFMESYAFFNQSTGRYDLGPPMYPVSEDTPPNSTVNPTFELAYWRFGLEVAAKWRGRQGRSVPPKWRHVLENLAPFPIENDTYVTYEGIPDMWNNPEYTFDHPGLLGIYGLLPPTPLVNETVFRRTVDKVYETWNLTAGYGWDFPFQALTAARIGNPQGAVDFLTHPSFEFDDIGMPLGGTRVATPYFPASAALCFTIAAMAAGWRTASPGANSWPEGWQVLSEGFVQPL